MRLKPVRRWVIRGGRVIAETTPPQTTLLGEPVTSGSDWKTLMRRPTL